jgi:hypothetical protein
MAGRSSTTIAPDPIPGAGAPDRDSTATERIGRLDRLPGFEPQVRPPAVAVRARAVTAPVPRGRRPVRETRPLRPGSRD